MQPAERLSQVGALEDQRARHHPVGSGGAQFRYGLFADPAVRENLHLLFQPGRLVMNYNQQQIDLLDQLTGADWQSPRTTLWGEKPLAWIVTKTYQHTCEHGDTLLRMSLWWEHILGEIAKAQAKGE